MVAPSFFYRFNFTAVRGGSSYPLSLQELRLYSPDGLIPSDGITQATNPGGSSPATQTPSKVVDGDVSGCEPRVKCDVHGGASNKWLDFNIMEPCINDCTRPASRGPYSELEIMLDAQAVLTGYELITANDAQMRDPTAWTVWQKVGGVWSLIHTATANPPTTKAQK